MSRTTYAYCGDLGRRDARLFAHWWTVRGHSVRLERVGPKRWNLFSVYLARKKK